MHRVWCKPSTDEGKKFISPIRGCDAGLMFVMEVPICWVWKDKQIDPNVLREGLEKTLDRFPIAASRIVPKHPTFWPVTRFLLSDVVFSNVGSPGALLEYQTVEEPMPSDSAPAGEWDKYFVEHSFRRLGEPFGVPLLAARLTRFPNGGCALCVSVSHVLADGAAILQLLSTWSHFCGIVGNNQPELILPKDLPPMPDLDRNIKDVGSFKPDPLYESAIDGRYRTALGGGILNTHLLTDTVTEFHLHSSDLTKIKQVLSEKLEKPKWISSYEAIMSVLLRCLAIADDRDEFTCRAIVNVRGRCERVSKDYFGNALTYHRFQFKNAGEFADTAFAFHESLRGIVQNPAGLEHPHLEAEQIKLHGGQTNLWDRARLTRPYFHSVWDGEPVVNSWVGFDFFNMDFGLNGSKPQLLRVATSFRNHRHIHLYPTSPDGDITVRMQLTSAKMARFKQALADTGFGSLFREQQATLPKKSLIKLGSSTPRSASYTKQPETAAQQSITVVEDTPA